jgi:hypothetical protein
MNWSAIYKIGAIVLFSVLIFQATGDMLATTASAAIACVFMVRQGRKR